MRYLFFKPVFCLAINLGLAALMSLNAFAQPASLLSEKSIHLAQNKGGGDRNSDDHTASTGSRLTSEDRSFIKEYHSRGKNPSVKYDRDVSVGHELPESGLYYPIEGRESLSDYRYSIINDKTVLVDPRTRRIIEILD